MQFGDQTFCRFNVMLKKISFTPLMHAWWKDSIFTSAVILAAVLHLIILTLQFAMPAESDAAVKEIAVTLRPSKDKVEDSDFLAQADQQGSGTFREAHRM